MIPQTYSENNLRSRRHIRQTPILQAQHVGKTESVKTSLTSMSLILTPPDSMTRMVIPSWAIFGVMMFWTRCFSSDPAVPGTNNNVLAGRYQMQMYRTMSFFFFLASRSHSQMKSCQSACSNQTA